LIPELGIYRAAKLLIDQHGQEATIRAAERADQLLKAADIDGGGSGGPSSRRLRSFSATGVHPCGETRN
jgi:hypothetical protein